MLIQAQVSEWECGCFKWAVMFPEDLPGHKTKPEQESPSASRPTNERRFARVLLLVWDWLMHVLLWVIPSLSIWGRAVFLSKHGFFFFLSHVSKMGSEGGQEERPGIPSPLSRWFLEPDRQWAGLCRGGGETIFLHWAVTLMDRTHNSLDAEDEETWLNFWIVGQILDMRPTSNIESL